jgi:hypothetical protein
MFDIVAAPIGVFCTMAIAAPYPSRRQPRWSNPLFLRLWLGNLGQAIVVAMALVSTAVGLLCLANSVQPVNATMIAANSEDRVVQVKSSTVRVIPSRSHRSRKSSDAG